MTKVEKKSSRTIFRELALTSTIHGLTHIYKSKTYLQRWIWSIFFLAGLSTVQYFVIQNIVGYTNYPVITNAYKLSEQQEFPYVAVCFTNPVSNFPEDPKCFYNNQICSPINFRKKNTHCYEFNRGYTATNDPSRTESRLTNVDVLNSTIPGINHGLRLSFKNELNLKNNLLRIRVNNYKTNVNSNAYIPASFGLEIDLILSRSIVNKLDQPYSDCKKEFIFEINETVQSFQYFQSECFILCKELNYAKFCNLTDEFEKIKHYYFTDIIRYFEIDLFKNCDDKSLRMAEDFILKNGEMEVCREMCPFECNSVFYTIEPRYNFKNTPVEKNKVYINLYYSSLVTQYYEESPKFEPGDLFANIGNYFGKKFINFFEYLLQKNYNLYYILF